MMKQYKHRHKVVALLLVMLLAFGTVPAAFAADEPSTGIIYKGKSAAERWIYQDVDTTYTPTDLFCNFKGVMPGDTLVQDFIVKNESTNKIKLYMQVLPHGADNPLSDKVAQATDLDDMIAFLNQLSLQVTVGEGDTEKVLFDIPQGKLGTFEGSAELGYLLKNTGAVLHVKLNVPITLNNAYMQEIGEVDFVFTIEEITSGGGGTPPSKEDPKEEPKEEIDDPDTPSGPIVIPGEPIEEIEDPDIPTGVVKTGDTSDILMPILLMLLSLIGIIAVRKWTKRADA